MLTESYSSDTSLHSPFPNIDRGSELQRGNRNLFCSIRGSNIGLAGIGMSLFLLSEREKKGNLNWGWKLVRRVNYRFFFSCKKQDVKWSKLEFKFAAEISETETTFLHTKEYKSDSFHRSLSLSCSFVQTNLQRPFNKRISIRVTHLASRKALSEEHR